MADLVGIEAAAKTIAEAIDRNVPKLINGIFATVTQFGSVANTAVDKIDVALKRNVDNLFAQLKPIMPKISIDIQTKEVE